MRTPSSILVRNGTARQKDQAAAAVAGLAARNDGYKLRIARAGGVAALVELARDGTDRQKSLAVRGLYCLAKDEGIRDEIYRRGGYRIDRRAGCEERCDLGP